MALQTYAPVGFNNVCISRNVEYSWNEGGRLDELRTRNVARKFLKIWIKNTFGPVLPRLAESHYNRLILQKAFAVWREEWWTSRIESALIIRADCHYRYNLCLKVFLTWKMFTSSQQKKRRRTMMAQAHTEKQSVSQSWQKWMIYRKKRRWKNMMLSSALEFNRRAAKESAWSLWKLKLQQHQEIDALKDHSETWPQETKSESGSILKPQNEDVDHVYSHNHGNIRRSPIWRETETQESIQEELYALKSTLNSWKNFVQIQKQKKSRLEKMQLHYQTKLKKSTFTAWRNHHVQTSQAQNHFQHHLQLRVLVAWRANAVLRRHQQRETLSRLQCSLNKVLLLHFFTKWREATPTAVQLRSSMEKAERHHRLKLLSKALKEWKEKRAQRLRYKAMKRQGILLLRLKTHQLYLEQWRLKLQHRRRESVQTEQALWHWSLSLQAKVLGEWRRWTKDRRRRREETSRAVLVYGDRSLQEGVTHILTYAAHVNDLTVTLMQQSKRQHDSQRRMQSAVKRCAMKWKERALCRPRAGHAAGTPRSEKNVTFSLRGDEVPSQSNTGKKDLLSTSDLRRQPRCCVEEPQESEHIEVQQSQHPSANTLTHVCHPAASHGSGATKETHQSDDAASSPVFTSDHQITPNQDLLLPPSAFMTSEKTVKRKVDAPRFEDRQESDAETERMSALTEELNVIRQELKSFHQAKQQLRSWRQLKDILQNWLQTSGEEDEVEKKRVRQELNELKERIKQLSTDLSGRKPKMLLNAERIRFLRTTLPNKKTKSLKN